MFETRASAGIVLFSPSYVDEPLKELGSVNAVENRGDAVGTSYVG
jgi:hypothetical protein